MSLSLLWPFLLIVLGLALLAVEVFVPSGGVLFILSVLAILAGIALIFVTPEGGTTMGLIATVAVIILMPTVVFTAFHYLPRTPWGKRFVLPEPDADQTMAAMPEYLELEQLRGQVGKTVTPLRPSGITLIQGHRIDTKTEGLFVDSGQWVRVVDVRAGQVTVRPLAEDELRELPDILS